MKLYDGPKVLFGLFVFVVFALSPLLINVLTNAQAEAPVVPHREDQVGGECILPTDEMRTSHMELLDTWRDEVVREGTRLRGEVTEARNENGVLRPRLVGDVRAPWHLQKSLSNTCMDCHRPGVCDSCHEHAGVDPACFDCHTDESVTGGGES